MNIIFYNYNGYSNKLNKTLTGGDTLSGDFNINYDTSDTVIKLRISNDFNYNYCYIPSLERYYFVTVKEIYRNGIVLLSLHIDVLQTYKEKILAASIRLADEKTQETKIFTSDDIVNGSFVNVMVTLGGV